MSSINKKSKVSKKHSHGRGGMFLNWIEYRNKEQTENELEKLKEYIKKYPDIANRYVNELIEK